MFYQFFKTAFLFLVFISLFFPSFSQTATPGVTPVYMTIDNVVDNGITYEFDVIAECADTFLLNTFQIYFGYNNAAFGLAIVRNAGFSSLINNNPHITLYGMSPPPLVVPKYKLINVVDNAPDIVAITADTRFLVPYPACYPTDTNKVTMWLPGDKKAIAHIVLTYTDNTQPPGVSLALSLMLDQFIGGNGGRCQLVQGDISVLPAVFNDISATPRIDGSVDVAWEAYEEGIERYIVERQISQNYFEPVGAQVATGNNETQSYTFNDHAAPTGKLRYRLQAVDVDGNFTYSKTVEVTLDNTQGIAPVAYPSPVTDHLQITNIDYEVATTATIVDMQGRVYWKGTISPEGISVSNLASGLYVLRVRGIADIRFIKE